MFEFVSVTDLKPNQFIAHTAEGGREVNARVLEVRRNKRGVYIRHTWSKGDLEHHRVTDYVVVVG